MAKYCSTDARKIIETISEYGVDIPIGHYFLVEQAIGKFWHNHIKQVIDKIMQDGDPSAKIDKLKAAGFTYFKRPIESILTPRTAAYRSPSVTVLDESRLVYDIITTHLCLMDFNIDELRLATSEIPLMVQDDVLFLSRSIDACKRASARSVFYLHGVVRREYQTIKGRIREAREEQSTSTVEIPATFDKLDVVERREIQHDWAERVNSIKISKSLNNV